jgi:hypothetical protein
MSAENVEILRRGYEHLAATGELLEENFDPEFVWDISTFRKWPERQTYEGIEGAKEFLAAWVGAWEDWELAIEALHDAGDKVVAIARQRGRVKATGSRSTCTSPSCGRCVKGSSSGWRCARTPRRRWMPSALGRVSLGRATEAPLSPPQKVAGGDAPAALS